MLQVARLAPTLLGDAAERVTSFLRSKLNDDGGFADRSGASDLYYTVFGLEGLMALRADVPRQVEQYVRSFGAGSELDFVHVSCLARCWAGLPPELRQHAPRDAMLRRVEAFRSQDGSYSISPGAKRGTLYGCFLALGAYEDLGAPVPDPQAMLQCAARLRTGDGGYANQEEIDVGLTPSTAAAATLLRHLGQGAEPSVADWLLSRCRPEGGFFAAPEAPIPDLLSTATALHALSGMHVDLDPIRESCLDFIDTLWTSKGAFYGNWADDIADCEYTYYGLLALGHLSL
jgi:prenyltransferase beta subunit